MGRLGSCDRDYRGKLQRARKVLGAWNPKHGGDHTWMFLAGQTIQLHRIVSDAQLSRCDHRILAGLLVDELSKVAANPLIIRHSSGEPPALDRFARRHDHSLHSSLYAAAPWLSRFTPLTRCDWVEIG